MDDIEIYGLRGYNEIVGDSTRGMQHTLGAQASPALKALLQRQAAVHAPATRGVGPQYKDSTQLPVNVQVSLAGTFGAFPAAGLPASAVVRVQTPFKPEKMVASASFSGTTAAGAVYWQQQGGIASDVLLVGAFVGSKNCFPTAPSNNLTGGVNLGAYAPNALGNGISWPTADAGIDITVNLLILPSFVSSYAGTAALTAYTSASLFITLLGPSLR